MNKKISRREFIKLGAMTAAGAALASCTPSSTTAPPSTEAGPTTAPVSEDGATVTWWYAWGNLDPATEKIIASDDFIAHMGKDKLEYKGNVDREAFLAAIAAGTPPDGASNYDYPNLFTRGAAIAVNDLAAGSAIVKKDVILEELWNASFLGDQMIGVPALESYLQWGLNYNSQAVTDAGLDADKPPVTWDEALEWHKALTKFDSAGNLLQFGLDPYDAMASEQDFAAMSWGFTWWDEKTNKFDLSNPLMAEALNTGGEFIRIVGPDKFQGMRQIEANGSWGAAFNAGVQNMIIEGYWHPGETQIQQPEVAQYNKANWALVPASRSDHKIQAVGVHFVQILKEGKQPAGMFKFAEYLLTPPALDIIFKEVGWVTGVRSWLTTMDSQAYPGLDFYVKAAEEATDWFAIRRCPIHQFVVTQYTEMREQVYRDLMTPQDAANELQTRAEAEWKAQGLS